MGQNPDIHSGLAGDMQANMAGVLQHSCFLFNTYAAGYPLCRSEFMVFLV
jgi:hypothetical protein